MTEGRATRIHHLEVAPLLSDHHRQQVERRPYVLMALPQHLHEDVARAPGEEENNREKKAEGTESMHSVGGEATRRRQPYIRSRAKSPPTAVIKKAAAAAFDHGDSSRGKV